MAERKKKVVIVGSGLTARMLVKALASSKKALHITVIQPNQFAELAWNCTCEITKKDTFESNSTITPVQGIDETIYGVAVGCGDGVVAVKPFLDDQHQSEDDVQLVPFDVVVCATGVCFPTILSTPGQSAQDRKAQVKQVSDLLTSPDKNIVIAGGGHVGVELAGDALDERGPDATGTFTLVCSADRLLSDRPNKYGTKALKKLEEMGCTVLFNDRVTNQGESVLEAGTTVQLKSGTSLDCDAYIAAYNRGPNTGWLSQGLPDGSSSLPKDGVLNDERKQVIVNDYLACKAYPKLFAIGATNDRNEACVGMNLEGQTKTIAANILSAESKEHGNPTVEFPLYQTIGRKYAFVSPDALPGGTLIFKWCGFPCNLLCPCFLCGCLCGPLSPMCCECCCAEPEGKGFVETLTNFKRMGLSASFTGYKDLGKAAPVVMEKMDR